MSRPFRIPGKREIKILKIKQSSEKGSCHNLLSLTWLPVTQQRQGLSAVVLFTSRRGEALCSPLMHRKMAVLSKSMRRLKPHRLLEVDAGLEIGLLIPAPELCAPGPAAAENQATRPSRSSDQCNFTGV